MVMKSRIASTANARSAGAPELYDAVVVGLGGVGSFALRGLARQGNKAKQRFLGIERFAVGHGFGSSHNGKTRIYRRAYFEHANYVPWIEHSLQVFRELQQESSSSSSLMQECGTLIMEPWQKTASSSARTTTPTPTTDDLPPLIQSSWQSAIEHDIPVEFLDPAALKERFPQFQQGFAQHATVKATSNHHELHLPDDKDEWVGLLEPGGGFLRVNAIQDAVMEQIRRQEVENVDILEHAHVEALTYHDDEEKLITLEIRQEHPENNEMSTTTTTTVTTKCLLVSMGAWTSQLFPSWAPYLTVKRQLQGWINVQKQRRKHDSHTGSTSSKTAENLYSCQHMPAFVIHVPKVCSKHLYGVPCDDYDSADPEASQWLKIGIHGRDDLVDDPTSNHQREVTETEQSEITQVSKAVFGQDTFQSMNSSNGNGNGNDDGGDDDDNILCQIQPCMYTMTPDGHYMLGTPREYMLDESSSGAPIFCVAGLSGHGYKQTPALGQMMVDFALHKDGSRNDEKGGGSKSRLDHVRDKWKLQFCDPSRFGV